MNTFEKYKFWLENEYFDEETKSELKKIEDNPKEIEERFYKDLEFGTGGLRGIIGAGTNRMNKYTVRRASQGFANYICSLGDRCKKKGMVIAYDSRRNSDKFALEAAKVFAGNGIRAYLFDELRPVPELSFAVRYLNAAGGVVITASHNPKEYNGYKAYGQDGSQLSLKASADVINEVNKLPDITNIKLMKKEEAEESGLLNIIGREIDDKFISSLKTLCVNINPIKEFVENIKVVYTPLHGSGNKPVRRILDETGFKNVLVVKEQEYPDADFSNVKNPNPEEKSSFELAVKLANEEDAHLILGTDPDCDRVGVMVRNPESEFIGLTGNQVGILLMEYILSQRKNTNNMPDNGFVVSTIVSTELVRVIANHYNIELVEVLTGFKFIGEKITQLDEFGDKKFLYGFEESYGYLTGPFVRDKDGVVTCMLVAEMAAFYKSRGMSVYDGLQEIYKKYGYYVEDITSFLLKGKEGIRKISNVMDNLRSNKPERFNDHQVTAVRDYLSGERVDMLTNETQQLSLPQSNVLYYEMSGGAWLCIRPSGTEPKIKIYYGVSEKSMSLAEGKLRNMERAVLDKIEKMINCTS